MAFVIIVLAKNMISREVNDMLMILFWFNSYVESSGIEQTEVTSVGE